MTGDLVRAALVVLLDAAFEARVNVKVSGDPDAVTLSGTNPEGRALSVVVVSNGVKVVAIVAHTRDRSDALHGADYDFKHAVGTVGSILRILGEPDLTVPHVREGVKA